MCDVRDGYDSRVVTRTLLTDLASLRIKHGLVPDLVFFTGDLAFGHLGSEPGYSLKDQFRDVQQLIDKIRGAYSPTIPLENVFLIPGNHDVKRDEVTDSDTHWLDNATGDTVRAVIEKADKQWMRFTERLAVYKQFLEEKGYPHLLVDGKRLVYAVKKKVNEFHIGIAGFNTAWSCCRDNEKARLWLGGWQALHLSESLHDCGIRFALMHHPLDWFHEREDTADLAVLLEREFTFLLNGHDHKAWVQEINDRHIRIAAGACYNRLKIHSHNRIGYNVTRYTPATGQVDIFLRTWNHDGAGWVPQQVPNFTDSNGRWTLRRFFPQRARPLPKPVLGTNVGTQTSLAKEAGFRSDTRKMVGLRGSSQRQLDAFLAVPMAALDPEAYTKQQREGWRVLSALKKHCGLEKVYYPASHIRTVDKFDPPEIAVKRGLSAIRYSRLFIMIYSAQQPSSVLVEAGFALALRIPSLYFVHESLKLPFLLNAADKAFKDVVVSRYASVEDILDYIERYGREVIGDLKQAGRKQRRW